MKKNKQRNKHIYKIIISTFIYILLLVSLLAPIMTIEGGNRTLGFIILGVLSLLYLLILTVFIWDWIKE